MRILARSAEDAFLYVMDHYAPVGLENFASRTDTYAVISIQDTNLSGFGFEFKENYYCKGVLTLYFDDIVKPVDDAALITSEQAKSIADFAENYKDKVDTLLVHCYAGESRSVAVALALAERLGIGRVKSREQKAPNEYVYKKIIEA